MYPKFDYFKIKWGTCDESPTLNKKIMKEHDVIMQLKDSPAVKGKLVDTSSEEDGWFVLTDEYDYDGGWNIEAFDDNFGYSCAWHTGCHTYNDNFQTPFLTKVKIKNKLYKL